MCRLKLVLTLCLVSLALNNLNAQPLSSTQNSGIVSGCPVIKTTLGEISGIQQQTVLGNSSFCSYRGIRYAEAPVGKLRFKAPIKAKRWQGRYNASEYGATCVQQSWFAQVPYTNISEDCLFLNVFVPNKSVCTKSSNIPVIFVIHGGSFTEAKADDFLYGPQLIMNDCVILVTINYRLGAFGFLPLALKEYSGNMGLKDQQLALEWVKQYIPAFGGNPKQVTLMGHSAGSSSISYHRLNSKSRSLFKQAYAMSGTSLSYFALLESNNKTDLIVELARNQSVTITNTDQLIEYIQTVDVDYIVNQTSHYGDYDITFITPWAPCIEPKYAAQAFLTDDPEVLLKKGVNVPSVYGHMSMEYIIFSAAILSNPNAISYLDQNFTFPLPFHFINQTSCKQELVPIFADIRQFYFGDAVINGSQLLPYMQLTSYMNFAYSVQKEVVLQAQSKTKANLRLLRLNHRTLLSMTNSVPGASSLGGTSHGDDACDYFWCGILPSAYDVVAMQETLAEQLAFKVSKVLREILISFAVSGNPESETTRFESLPPTTSQPLNDLPFTELLSVGTLAAGSNPDDEEFKFWWGIDQQVQKIKKMSCNK